MSTASAPTGIDPLRLLVEEVPAAIAIFDREMRYIAASRRWKEEYLPGSAEVVGRCHYDLLPDCPERWRLDHRRGLRGETVKVHHDSWTLPDGSTLWMRYEVQPWRDAGGEVAGILILTEDITDRKRAADELHSTNARLKAALSSPDIALFEQDSELRYTWIHNPALGFSPAQVVGKRDLELMSPKDAAAAALVKKRAMSDRRPVREEICLHEGEEERWYELLVEPSLDEHGNAVGIACVAIDITQRRKAQRALEASEERLSVAKSAAGLGIHDYNVLSGEISWDARVRELWGVGALEPVTYETFVSGLHPEDVAGVEEAVSRALNPAKDGLYCAEYRVVSRRDGKTRWVAATGKTTFADGRAVRLVGTVQDISERKQIELERERTSALLDAVLMSMPAGVMIADPDGRLVRWNKANEALWGTTTFAADTFQDAHRLVQLKGWTYPGGKPLGPNDWPMMRALLQGETVRGETIEIEPLDGSGRKVMLKMAAPAFAANGTVLGAVAVQTDITDRIRIEEALKRADRQKDVFLATLSHELRNPLAPIRTAADLLANPKVDQGQLGWIQGVIQRQVGHLAWLLDDLLDLARITQGKLELRREAVSLGTVVGNAVEEARPLIDRKNHRLSVHLPSAVPYLNADPVRSAQILANLLTNAAKYTDPGGLIELEARLQDHVVQIEVRDNGVGISRDALPSMFEMFSQASASLERAEGGLGIGLALVKGLTELHGGSVRVSSNGIGCGSSFVVNLPLAEQKITTSIADDYGPSAEHKCKVLVVDDNRDGADALAMSLSLAGHEVRTAYDGSAALAAAQMFRPEVALLDIGMPELSGHELAKQLRAEPWGRSIHLVAITGWGQEEDRRRSMAAGFNEHLTKPVEPSRLVRLLQTFQAKRELQTSPEVDPVLLVPPRASHTG